MQRSIRQNLILHLAGTLWPLVLLAPFVPGLPRPTNSGATWRQELVLGALVTVTVLALLRRAYRSDSQLVGFFRSELLFVAALLAFTIWSALSLFWSTNTFSTLHYSLSWSLYLLFFFLARHAIERPRGLRISVTLFALVVVVIALANIVGHLGASNSLLRKTGLGEPLAISVPFFVALALRLRRARTAFFCGVTAVLAFLAVIQIAERASFVAVSAGLLVLASCMTALRQFRPANVTRAAVMVAALGAIFAFQTVPSPFAQTVHQPVLVRLSQTSTDDINTRARFLYWASAIEMWRLRPLVGIGAGGYESAMPAARIAFSERYPGSPLVSVNEKFLTGSAHNEYLQILAETGIVGLALFAMFCSALVIAAVTALRRSRSVLAPAAVASLTVFALSSGASSLSFRWMGSGILFFFFSAIIVALATRGRHASRISAPKDWTYLAFTMSSQRRVLAGMGLATVLIFCAFALHASNVTLLALAQSSPSATASEHFFQQALRLNPLDTGTHYNFGVWLNFQKREKEAIDHLSYALERGFNTSTCFMYLASAQEGAGDIAASEATLARAVRVFPRSIFLRVRHAAALDRNGLKPEAERELQVALGIEPWEARGWQQLIYNDIDVATEASRREPPSAAPGLLQPEDGVLAVIHENERRFPEAISTGWRLRRRKALGE